MFSGIVDAMAQIVKIEQEQSNKHFTLRNPYAEAMGIDQSIAHNGVCLTVVRNEGDTYVVTAMQETLNRSNLGEVQEGDWVNLERAMVPYGGTQSIFAFIVLKTASTYLSSGNTGMTSLRAVSAILFAFKSGLKQTTFPSTVR